MKRPWVIPSLLGLLAVSVLASLATGAVRINLSDLFSADNAMIVFDIRLPRIVLALLVGSGLSVAGLIFQSVLQNPLAEPYTLGISGGAALGVGLFSLLGFAGVFGEFWRIIGASAGSLLSIALVYALSRRDSFSNTALVLAGIVISYLFASLVLFLYAILNPVKFQSVMLWLMGDLSSASPLLVWLSAPVFLVLLALLLLMNRELNIITLGAEKAASLGLNAVRVKQALFLTASLLTGLCVALSGVIGFVGLIIPHLMRPLTGPSHARLIPASMLAGSVFLLLSDTFGRTVISPVELPVGVITGICGGIFFLLFFFRKKRIPGAGL
jgi:iron complex transport system permease protein